jgi:hypothetical protein
MRTTTRWTLALALSSAGCLPGSIYPLYESSADLVSAPELVGTWVEEDSGEQLVFLQEKDRHYALVAIEEGTAEAGHLEVRLVRCGPALFWDLSATEPEGGISAAHLLPLHSFARVQVGDGRLEVAGLSQDWWQAQLQAGGVLLSFEKVGDRLILTAPSRELCGELGRHADERDAFESPDRFRLLR